MTTEKLQYLLTADDKVSATFARVTRQLGGMAGQAQTVQAAFAGLGRTLGAGLSVAGLVAFGRATINSLDKLNDLADATGASVEQLAALEDVAVRTGTSVDTAGDAVIRLNKALADAKPGSDTEKAFKALGLSVEALKAQDPVTALQNVARALSGFADDGNKARLVQELFGKSLREVAPLLNDLATKGLKPAGEGIANAAREAEKFNQAMASMQKNASDLARSVAGPLLTSVNALFEAFRRGKESGKGFLASAIDIEKIERIVQKNAGTYGNEGRNYPKPTLPAALGGDDKAGAAAAKKAATDRVKLAEFAALQVVAIEQQAAQDTAEAWKVWETQQIDAYKERADAAKLQWQQVFEFIDQEQERAIQEGEAIMAATARSGRTAADELGLVFSSAAGQAIANFGNLRDVLKGVLADIAQIALKQLVTEPLEKFLSPVFAGLFTSANGNAFGPAGVIPFASGGVVNSPTLFKFANGTGLMGEAGPEAILPLKRGANGKLGVQGGGGASINYAPVTYIDSRSDRAQVAALVAQANQAGQAQLLQYLQQQGVVA